MIQRRKFLQKLFVFYGSLALVLGLCTSASASVIDAPHNETNNVKCRDCHTYSLWWKYSPATTNGSPPYNEITNAVCDKCHAANGSAPTKIPHNSTSMADLHDTYLGTWETKCVDCHSPHYQDQLNWLAADPTLSDDLYLATGTINAGSIQVNSGTNTTTLTYKNADADPNWISPALWPAKSSPGRGLILVIRDNTQSTFEIIAATEGTTIIPGSAIGTGTITVQGSIPTSYNPADTDFALIYGQLVKKSIATPTSGVKEVKFFDASITYADNRVGGTVDPVGNQGICQVCHTQTKYYNADGLQPDRTNPANPRVAATPHNRTATCTGCHAASLGFRPTNADHTFISNLGTTCAACHDQADIISGTHLGNCVDCHDGAPVLISPFPSAKWPTASGQLRNTGNCYDCHSPIAAAFTAHPQANDHSGQVDPYPNCVGCHFHANKDVVNEIHGADGSPCDTCHSLTYNGGSGTYSGSGALIGKAAQHGPGNCTTCHTDIAANFFVHPQSNDHGGQVDATPACTTCHNGDPVNDVHSWSCGMCHSAPTGLLKSVALSKGPGDCMHCHTNFYVHLTTTPHTSSVTATSACVSCHANPDLINGLHGRNGCGTCHDQYGTLVGSAAGHAGGGDCALCHAVEAAAGMGHPATDHTTMNTYVVANPEGNCTSCHTGDPVEIVHNKNCLGCHLALNTTDINTLVGSAAGHGGHQSNTCIDCHGTIGSRFTAHQKAYDHDLQVTALGTNCYTCHTGVDPIWDIHVQNCGRCHAADGRLVGSAAGKGTGKPPTTGNSCSACHADPKYNTTTGEPPHH